MRTQESRGKRNLPSSRKRRAHFPNPSPPENDLGRNIKEKKTRESRVDSVEENNFLHSRLSRSQSINTIRPAGNGSCRSFNHITTSHSLLCIHELRALLTTQRPSVLCSGSAASTSSSSSSFVGVRGLPRAWFRFRL